MNDIGRSDLIALVRQDVEKIKLLAGDLTEKYLPMTGNPIDLPQSEWNKFIKSLGYEYWRYSIISELIFDTVLAAEGKLKKLDETA